MSNYYPDNWVVIHILSPKPHYKVLAGWSGGYLQGDSWRMNSGIVDVSKKDQNWIFEGSSGSQYFCVDRTYGLRMNNAYIWNRLSELHGDKIELMPEDTDWTSIDWMIKKSI